MTQWDDFDRGLAEDLAELPPPPPAEAPTPWRQAVERVVLGLCLSSFTLQLWYLQYLLPLLGTVQLYLGFRTLRKNNRWFFAAWISSICKAILLFTNLLLSATPFGGILLVPRTAAGLLLTFLPLAFFRQALRREARSVGAALSGDPLLWAMVWYAVLVGLALVWPQPGFLLFLLLAYVFYRIVRSLLRVAGELEDWGYAVTAAPVRMSAGRLTALCCGSLAALVLLSSLWSNHVPVAGTAAEAPSGAPEVTAVRERLTQLGFPEELLARLPEEEILLLTEAERCWVSLDTRGEDGGTVRFDDVQVQTGVRTVRCYHFFTLEESTPRAVFQNGIRLTPDSGQISQAAAGLSWTRDSVRYDAGLALEQSSFLSYFGDSFETYSARFSYPPFTEDRQGWGAYTAVYPEGWLGAATGIHYVLPSFRDLYPYASLLLRFQQGTDHGPTSSSYTTFSWDSAD